MKVEAPKGPRRCWTLELDPDAAKVVSWIFERAGQGTSLGSIAAELNTGGVPPVSGKIWNAQTVRQILCNRAYTGVGGIGRNTDQCVEIEGTHPEIVIRTVFDKVQEVLYRITSRLRKSRG